MAAIVRAVKYAASNQKERDTARQSSMTPGSYGHFPPSMGLFYVQPGEDYKSQQFYLAEIASERLYAVTFHNGYGSRQMTLYSESKHESSPLAISANESRASSNAAITLPSLKAVEGSTMCTEQLKYSFGSSKFTFSAYVGCEPERQIETFEWRLDKNSSKPQVRRLARLAGEEVEFVARWVEGTVPTRQGKIASFEFLGSGATGELGEYWALMAVASALRICQWHWYVELLLSELLERFLTLSSLVLGWRWLACWSLKKNGISPSMEVRDGPGRSAKTPFLRTIPTAFSATI